MLQIDFISLRTGLLCIYYFKFDIWYCIPGSQMSGKRKAINISTNDRVSVFLELAQAHRLVDEQVRNRVP